MFYFISNINMDIELTGRHFKCYTSCEDEYKVIILSFTSNVNMNIKCLLAFFFTLWSFTKLMKMEQVILN